MGWGLENLSRIRVLALPPLVKLAVLDTCPDKNLLIDGREVRGGHAILIDPEGYIEIYGGDKVDQMELGS